MKVIASEVWCNGSSPKGSKNHERRPLMTNVVINSGPQTKTKRHTTCSGQTVILLVVSVGRFSPRLVVYKQHNIKSDSEELFSNVSSLK